MEYEEIKNYCKQYDDDPNNQSDIEIEKSVGNKIREQQSLTLDDLIKITGWKFEGLRYKQRKIDDVKKNLPEQVEKITEKAFKSKDDEIKLLLLKSLNGIGTATASAILAFYDPENYGVIDEHVWAELFGQKNKRNFEIQEYLAVQERFRKDKEKHSSLRIRDIEKAYYQKNIESRTN